ncbi:hypothetical protein [Pseudactinotalea terrae]|uniref:hypothetical protein n=1 Tax=Pseudactinotalea terrae TaxID=1743262 RepID=UPI0012E287D9|nr:hypothetical protein [Pseudactinotalea terrae]
MSTDYFTTDEADSGVPEFPTQSEVTERDEDAEVIELDEDETSGSEVRRTRSTRRAGSRRAEVRRDIAKYIQLTGVNDEDLQLLGTLYGVAPDPLELTVAIMAGSRASLAAVNDLRAIAEADPFEAPLVAAALAPAQLKTVHSLLVSLGGASTKDLPGGAVTKAAGRLARDVHGLGTAARDRLDRVLGLTKRTV